MNRAALQVLAAASLLFLPAASHAQAGKYFRLQIVDEATNRGVPLVELRTTSNTRFVSDSNGLVAVGEPELLNQKVYFSVSSHGYEHPADMFGNRGVAFDVAPGKSGQIKLKRINIAERLYRITGAGIYRDTILLGERAPTARPLLNGLVTGQDTVQATPYKGKLFWLWGDTNRPAYPLGNFFTSSATSMLPKDGGLDPSKGVDLTYWVDNEGFSKKMMPLPGSMPVWLGGLFAIREDGGEYLFAHYAQVQSDSKANESGLALFNDQKAEFEKVAAFPNTTLLDGHPFQATSGGRRYVYSSPSNSSEVAPLLRALATRKAVSDPSTYEAFTCLAPGARFDGAATKLDRAPDGKLRYAWKPNTAPLTRDQRKTLIDAGKMKEDEAPILLRDVETNAPIQSHGGSVSWNPYRKRWVMIAAQAFGNPSYLGEMWFSEADTPVGPWVYARKIVTHNKYTFYNPTHHPFFDQDGGRLIYFEGTYTHTYSGNEDRTPLYDYNQIMYRLSLDDPRLSLPCPVYRLRDGSLAMREEVEARGLWRQVESIPFFAVPPSRARAGLVAVRAREGGAPMFYALPAQVAAGEKAAAGVVELRAAGGAGRFEVEGGGAVVARVWRNPSALLALDFETKPL